MHSYENINFSTCRANDSVEQFLEKDLTLHTSQSFLSLNLILNVNLYDDILTFLLTFSITLNGGCSRNRK